MTQNADGIALLAARAEQIAARLRSTSEAGTPETVDTAIKSLDQRMRGVRYNAIPEDILRLEGDRRSFAPLLASTLLSRVESRMSGRAYPASVAAELCRQGNRILDGCEAADPVQRAFRTDVFQKDLGVCRLEIFPCVAQVVEQDIAISPRLVLRQPFTTMLGVGARMLRQGGLRPYYDIHTHTPMLDGFNEPGWRTCYLMIAQLLQQQTHILGVYGSSWFFDPQVPPISPRLAYLRDLPLSGGATFLRSTASAQDITLATSKSSTRKALYESGKYMPAHYAMIWQRNDLLRWAASAEHKTSVS